MLCRYKGLSLRRLLHQGPAHRVDRPLNTILEVQLTPWPRLGLCLLQGAPLERHEPFAARHAKRESPVPRALPTRRQQHQWCCKVTTPRAPWQPPGPRREALLPRCQRRRPLPSAAASSFMASTEGRCPLSTAFPSVDPADLCTDQPEDPCRCHLRRSENGGEALLSRPQCFQTGPRLVRG